MLYRQRNAPVTRNRARMYRVAAARSGGKTSSYAGIADKSAKQRRSNGVNNALA